MTVSSVAGVVGGVVAVVFSASSCWQPSRLAKVNNNSDFFMICSESESEVKLTRHLKADHVKKNMTKVMSFCNETSIVGSFVT